MVLFPGPPATLGDVLFFAAITFFVLLILSCRVYRFDSVASFLVALTVFVGQVSLAYASGPYAGGVQWSWELGGPLQWFLFVLVALCNCVGTLTSAPAAGALMKRLCDPSLQPWSEEAPEELEGGAPSLTVLVPCYMPNEESIIEGTIEHIMRRVRYPRGFRVIVCYNTPRALPIERQLALREGEVADGAVGGTRNTLHIMKVEGSTSKARR